MDNQNFAKWLKVAGAVFIVACAAAILSGEVVRGCGSKTAVPADAGKVVQP